MARTCIFCGQTANSVEDAWPLWLTQRFIAPGAMEAQPGIDAPLKTWRVNRPELRLKWVCTTCNNGWMSQLETRAEPVITRLLNCTTCTLDVHDCKTLTLWAVKTAMVLEAINGPERCLYSDLERCLLSHKRDQVPPFTFVWIAKWIDSAGPSSISRILSRATTPDRATVTTLAFGCLAIQVLKVVPRATLDPAMNITMEQREGPWEQVALQVWPQRRDPVSWPTLMGLQGEGGLDVLEKRFSPADAENEPALVSGDPGDAS